MSDLNIYAKLSKITAEIATVAKNLSVGYGASTYKATGEADILRAVKPIEEKHGVYSYPYKREIISEGITSSEKVKKDGTIDKKENLYLRMHTIYRFVNIDKPEEYIDIDTYGDGVDSGDKAPGKAMTYSDKYALMKAYKIITGDDPDQISSDDLDLNKAAIEYQRLRTKLASLGCDFRDEKTNGFIVQSANIKTQDIQKLSHEEIVRLLATYRAMIAAKEGNNEKQTK